ncbi:MAG: 7-carboxy-7-deazaguanine synthase QueE [Solirubrobacteraceae bacterium]
MGIAAPTARRVRTLPVIEIFGPTIQGEGAEAGIPSHFVRLGGCDYRCSWCDTMYAVDPGSVRSTAQRLSSTGIADQLDALGGAPRWVTISGGNPALHRLAELVVALHGRGYRVAVETQGSVWRDWLREVDRLTISPKPPSSGMASDRHERQLFAFMASALGTRAASLVVLKIVCFDESDVDWAKRMAANWPEFPLFLSAGTPVPGPPRLREAVGERYRWLCERVAADPDLSGARVLPQLHVIAWEEATGV